MNGSPEISQWRLSAEERHKNTTSNNYADIINTYARSETVVKN